MKKCVVALKKVEITNFMPKTSTVSLKVSYQRDNEQESMYKDVVISNPEELTAAIIKELKDRSKTELSESDDLMGSIFVIYFYDEDRIEEKLFNFLAKISEKARYLKHVTNHQEYMKTFDEIKVLKAVF